MQQPADDCADDYGKAELVSTQKRKREKTCFGQTAFPQQRLTYLAARLGSTGKVRALYRGRR